MEQNLVLAGNKIELKEIPRTFQPSCEQQLYHGRFLEWCKRDELKLAIPNEKQQDGMIEPGKLYLICLYTVKGLFQCKAVIKSCKMQEEELVIRLQIQSGLEKYRRRHYYRMVCALDVLYHIMQEEPNQDREAALYSGVILDLSGGGIRFNTNQMMEPGTQISLQLQTDLPLLTKRPWILARILSAASLPHKEGVIEHRAEFLEIPCQEREAVIQYIFLEERKRKGSNTGIELC